MSSSLDGRQVTSFIASRCFTWCSNTQVSPEVYQACWEEHGTSPRGRQRDGWMANGLNGENVCAGHSWGPSTWVSLGGTGASSTVSACLLEYKRHSASKLSKSRHDWGERDTQSQTKQKGKATGSGFFVVSVWNFKGSGCCQLLWNSQTKA